MVEPKIAFDAVTKRFGEGRVMALDGVSLAIAPGVFAAIVGESGAGKTTLLRLVNRLAEPSSGRVVLDGQDIAAIDPVILRRGIGFVHQTGALFPHLTVAENIAVTPRLLGWSRDAIHARVDELLSLMQLPTDYLARVPLELSGGQRQRVGIARALAAHPPVLLMDEPFGALDPLTRSRLGRDMRALHHRLGLTTVMVTHDIAEAMLLADVIVVMRAGRVVAQGGARDLGASRDAYVDALLATPRHQAAQLAALFALS